MNLDNSANRDGGPSGPQFPHTLSSSLNTPLKQLISLVCTDAGLAEHTVLDKFESGTHPAFRVKTLVDGKDRNVVIKLLLTENDGAAFFGRETSGYDILAGTEMEHLTPRILKRGRLHQIEGQDLECSYLIVTHAKGVCTSECFLPLNRAEKKSLAVQVGGVLKKLHSVTVPSPIPTTLDKSRLLSLLSSNATELIENFSEPAAGKAWRGLSPEASCRAASFVKQNQWLLEELGEHAFLHGDPHRDHFFIKRCDESDEIKISSLIDFADAVMFDPLYDFTSAHLDLFGGDLDLLKSSLESYGLKYDSEAKVKLMLLSLVHEFPLFGRMENDYLVRQSPFNAPLNTICWDDLVTTLWGHF